MAGLEKEVSRRWPSAPLNAARLKKCAAQPGDAKADLYLAASAAAGETWALEALEQEVFRPVRTRLARKHGATQADEALQQVREQLLVASTTLNDYAGKGPLAAWVTVIAVRKLMSGRDREQDQLDEAKAIANGTGDELELALLGPRYADVFREALRRALDSLDRRERLVLRMHTVDGLSAEKIGAIFHTHRATASKWISDARTLLRERAMREVREQAGLSSAAARSIGKVLARHTDLSLPRLLEAKPQ